MKKVMPRRADSAHAALVKAERGAADFIAALGRHRHPEREARASAP